MNKRKKASSSASRSTRGGHLLGPPRGKARAAKLNRAKVSADPGDDLEVVPAKDPASAKEPASNTLALAAECTVSDAGSLKERLTGLLDEPQAVTLDVTALQRIDTAGLQVITAFVLDRAANGRPTEWQGTAPVLATAAQLLGLTFIFKLPV